MYTVENFPTKAALKRAVAAGKAVKTFQAAWLFERFHPWTEDSVQRFETFTPRNGKVYLEGPHYPASHSWYASAMVEDGIIVPGSVK